MAMLLSLFDALFPSVQRIIKPSSEEWAELEVPEGSCNLIDIYDFGLNDQPEAQRVLKHEDGQDLENGLQKLPPLQGNSCRVYFMATCHTARQKSIGTHLQTLVGNIDQRNEKGFASLASQWSKTRRQAHHSLDFFAKATQKSPHPLRERFESIVSPRLMTEVVRVTPSIGCYRTDNKALVVVIDLHVSQRKLSGRHDDWFRDFFTHYVHTFIEQKEDQHDWPKPNPTNQELRIQLYLLGFYNTYFRLYKDFLSYVEHYDGEQSYMVDPRYSTLQPYTLADIVERAYHYNIFLEMATANSVVVGLLVSVMRATWIKDVCTEPRRLLAEIEATSDWLPKSFAQLTSRMSRHIELASLSRSMQESVNSRTLNLLACIFLPTSLATSLLSMSTRFVDLGPLLYDFCGVIVAQDLSVARKHDKVRGAAQRLSFEDI